MLRQRLIERYSTYTPYRSVPRSNLENEKPIFLNEWKLALIGLVLSLIVILTKIYTANQEYIKAALIEPRLVTLEVLTEDGQVMFTYAWKHAVKYSNIWLPALCGLLTTYFTWIMVYLDSHVPGIQPPSPLSPSKYKAHSGHSFHLNYVFAILVGLLVASYMYWRNISIQY